MKVIYLVQYTLKIVGALPLLAHSSWYRLWGFIILIIMTTNLYSYILAFIVNWGNAPIFLQTLAMSMGAFAAVAKSSTIIINHTAYATILNGFKDILEMRDKESQMKRYKEYNKIERNYSRLYGLFMLMSSQTIWMGPLISVLYGIHNGEYHYRYPCEVKYSWHEESLAEYIAFFSFSTFNIQLNAAFLFSSDAGFFGINLYLVAAFEDLMDRLSEIKQSHGPELTNVNLKKKFVDCVSFHRKILQLTDALETLYSPIIFCQIFMSCIQICAITLELILHEHIKMDRLIQVLPVYPTILAMLFIYCKFGTDVSIKASEVSTAVYNSEWYTHPLELQMLIPAMIQRAQVPLVISGFKIFPCTLQTYTKALNKIASLLTIMRQLLNK